jgi:hypothetical protein
MEGNVEKGPEVSPDNAALDFHAEVVGVESLSIHFAVLLIGLTLSGLSIVFS